MSEQHRRRIVISPGQEVVIRAAGDPTGDPLTAVLDEIQALGHTQVAISGHDDGRWYCHSGLPGEKAPGEDTHEWVVRTEFGQDDGGSAVEAAAGRLDEVRKLAAKRKEAP